MNDSTKSNIGGEHLRIYARHPSATHQSNLRLGTRPTRVTLDALCQSVGAVELTLCLDVLHAKGEYEYETLEATHNPGKYYSH